MTAAVDPTVLTEVFRALSDPTRREMLARLSVGPCSVTELSEPHAITPPAITKHLDVLERSGLIVRWKEGRTNFCHLVPEPLEAASGWIDAHREFWESQFGRLEDFLKTEKDEWEDNSRGKPRPPSGSRTSTRRRPPRSSTPGRTPKR